MLVMPDFDTAVSERWLTSRVCGAVERIFGNFGPSCTLDPGHEGDHEAHDDTKSLDDPSRIVSVWPRGAGD